MAPINYTWLGLVSTCLIIDMHIEISITIISIMPLRLLIEETGGERKKAKLSFPFVMNG